MQDWRETRAVAEADLKFRLNNGPELTRRVTSKETTKLLRSDKQQILEVKNLSDEVVTIGGHYKTTSAYDDVGDVTIEGYTLCEHLYPGRTGKWPVGKEDIEATIRPECITLTRLEYLSLLKGDNTAGEHSLGIAAQDMFKMVFRRRGVEFTTPPIGRTDKITRDFPLVNLDGTETAWEIKSLHKEKTRKGTCTEDERPSQLEHQLVKAAKQLEPCSEKGTPTVVGLVNRRDWDNTALDHERIANALHGYFVATIDRDREKGKTTGTSGCRFPQFEHISAMATLTFHVAAPPMEERGRHISDFCENSAMIAVLSVYHNLNARVHLRPEALKCIKPVQYTWSEQPDKPVLVSTWRPGADGTWKTDRDWRGLAQVFDVNDPARRAFTDGIGEIHRAISKAANEGRTRVDSQVEVTKRTVGLRNEGLNCDQTMTKYVTRSAAGAGTALIAGSNVSVREVLKRVRQGERYDEIGKIVRSNLLPDDDPEAAVKTAAEYATHVMRKKSNLGRGNDHIERDPERCGGAPVLYGTRLRASHVMERIAFGETIDEIAEDWEIDHAKIPPAIEYAEEAIATHERRRRIERPE